MFKKLGRDFYRKDAIELSKDLLGKYLVHMVNYKDNVKDGDNNNDGDSDNYIDSGNESILIGKIVETEAYMGFHDKGAHTYNGKRTPRTEVMYGEEGHAYVYFVYGMYHCLNVVAAEEGIAQAVLIRALEPIEGLNKMSFTRFNKPVSELGKKQIINLTNGPGKLCKAFNISKDLNGEDLTKDKLYICRKKSEYTMHNQLKQLTENNKKNTESQYNSEIQIYNETFNIVESKRIGIDYAEEAKDFLWRFYIEGNEFVSSLK